LSKKKKVEKAKGKLTRHQLSRWQKQKRRQRLIIGIGISVIVAVVTIVSAGLYYQWYIPEIKPLDKIVTEVNGTQFKVSYLVDNLEFQLGGQSTEYISYFLDAVLQNIQRNELVRQRALALGITASDQEIEGVIDQQDLPDTQVVRDIVQAQLLIQKVEEQYIKPQVPIVDEQRHIMAMFLESESRAEEVRDRLAAGEDFGELAAELSLDSYTQENSGDLGWRPKGIINGLLGTTILEDFVFSYQVGPVSVPVVDIDKTKELGYWLVQVLERHEQPEEAHVRAILVGSEEEAQTVLSRLEAGDDFVELAEQYSQRWSDTEGADMGWLEPGDMSQAFDDFVFNPETELNTTSEPIRDAGNELINTTGGYWLFQVLGSEERQLSEEDRDTLADQAMNDWLGSVYNDPENNIVSYLDDEIRAFIISKFSG
jgi:parvulin-like peptidyl-prolyl isomerase